MARRSAGHRAVSASTGRARRGTGRRATRRSRRRPPAAGRSHRRRARPAAATRSREPRCRTSATRAVQPDPGCQQHTRASHPPAKPTSDPHGRYGHRFDGTGPAAPGRLAAASNRAGDGNRLLGDDSPAADRPPRDQHEHAGDQLAPGCRSATTNDAATRLRAALTPAEWRTIRARRRMRSKIGANGGGRDSAEVTTKSAVTSAARDSVGGGVAPGSAPGAPMSLPRAIPPSRPLRNPAESSVLSTVADSTASAIATPSGTSSLYRISHVASRAIARSRAGIRSSVQPCACASISASMSLEVRVDTLDDLARVRPRGLALRLGGRAPGLFVEHGRDRAAAGCRRRTGCRGRVCAPWCANSWQAEPH